MNVLLYFSHFSLFFLHTYFVTFSTAYTAVNTLKNAHHYKQLVITFSKQLTFYYKKKKKKATLCCYSLWGGGDVVNTVDQQVL